MILREQEVCVYSLAVSPDGQQLVSGSGDGTVRIWETRPLSVRLDARRKSAEQRPRAEASVRTLFEKLGDADRVVKSIEKNKALTPALRRAALHTVLRRDADG